MDCYNRLGIQFFINLEVFVFIISDVSVSHNAEYVAFNRKVQTV